MVYQHVKKRAKILPLATFHIAHLCKQFNQFALPISMPRFKSIIFYQYNPKIKLFLKKKCKIFKRWGLRPQTPVPPAAGGFAPRPPIASGSWGLCPQTPKTAPRNCEFLAMCCPHFALCIIVWCFVAFVLNNFFFTIQLQTL